MRRSLLISANISDGLAHAIEGEAHEGSNQIEKVKIKLKRLMIKQLSQNQMHTKVTGLYTTLTRLSRAIDYIIYDLTHSLTCANNVLV